MNASSSIISCCRRRHSARAALDNSALNRVGVGDVTMVPRRAGWLYVAVWLDLCSRRDIGWAMRDKPDQQLTLTALAMAIRQRRL